MRNLESAILQRFSDSYQERSLKDIDSKLLISHRETTELGFFTFFQENNLYATKNETGCITGPFIQSKQVPGGAMSLLYVNDGMIVFLEVMAMVDEENANQITEFEIGEMF